MNRHQTESVEWRNQRYFKRKGKKARRGMEERELLLVYSVCTYKGKASQQHRKHPCGEVFL